MISTRYFDKWTRRDASPSPRALSSCIALVILVAILAVPTTTSEAAESPSHERRPPRPNVLIFVTDDQRFDTLKHMPATRRLIGRKGVTFSNAFATTPLCCPARASIMTGRYAHNHNVRRNFQRRKLDMSTTVQHRLHEAGYLTSIVGKFLNSWNPTVTPPDFDRSILLTPVNSPFAQGTDAYYGSLFGINGRVRRVKRYATDFMRSRTTRILRQFNRRDRRPWMMFVNPFAPHSPAVPARRHDGAPVGGWHSSPAIRNRNRSEKAPDVRRRRFGPKREFAARQKRTLLAVDELVARVFKSMNRLSETRRTLVIFMSDNGMFWGEHGLQGKRFPYTHSIKIPMLMRWPGHVRPNSRTGRLVANIDIAPTVYDASGVEPAHVMDGRSLLSGERRKFVLLEHWEKTRWLSLRSRRYQYVEYFGRDGKELRFRELYNLKRDPWQLHNLLRTHPRRHREIASRLHRLLVRKAACRGAECL